MEGGHGDSRQTPGMMKNVESAKDPKDWHGYSSDDRENPLLSIIRKLIPVIIGTILLAGLMGAALYINQN